MYSMPSGPPPLTPSKTDLFKEGDHVRITMPIEFFLDKSQPNFRYIDLPATSYFPTGQEVTISKVEKPGPVTNGPAPVPTIANTRYKLTLSTAPTQKWTRLNVDESLGIQLMHIQLEPFKGTVPNGYTFKLDTVVVLQADATYKGTDGKTHVLRTGTRIKIIGKARTKKSFTVLEPGTKHLNKIRDACYPQDSILVSCSSSTQSKWISTSYIAHSQLTRN